MGLYEDIKARQDADEAERKRKFAEQQAKFNATTDERQRQTGMGDYARGGTKDVFAEATAKAEIKVAAQRAVIDEKSKGSISAGQRNPDGSRVTHASGTRPTFTDDEVAIKEKEILANKARVEVERQREIERSGGPNQTPGVYTRLAQKQNVQFQNQGRQGQPYDPSRGRDTGETKAEKQVRLKQEFERRTGEAQSYSASEKKVIERQKAQSQVYGTTIVGGPAKTFKAPKGALSQADRDFIALQESQGKYYTGEAAIDPISGQLQFYFGDKAESKKYHDDLLAFNRAQYAAREAEKANQEAVAKQEQTIKDRKTRANELGYEVTYRQATSDEIASGQFAAGDMVQEIAPIKGQKQSYFAGTGVKDYIETGFRQEGFETVGGYKAGERVDFSRTDDKGNVKYFVQAPPSQKAQSFEQPNQSIAEVIGGALFGEQGRVFAKDISIGFEQSANSLGAMIGVSKPGFTFQGAAIEGIEVKTEPGGNKNRRGEYTGKTVVAYSPEDAATIAKVGQERPGRIAGEVAFEAAVTGATAGVGPAGSKAVEVGGTAARKVASTFFKTGGKIVSKAPETKVVSSGTAEAVKESPSQAKKAMIKAYEGATGIKLNPDEVDVIGGVLTKSGGRLEIAPPKKTLVGRQKPTEYELVKTKDKGRLPVEGEQDPLGILTKEGTFVPTERPLTLLEAGKKVGQVYSGGNKLKNVAKGSDDLFAKEYTEVVESEATGLKRATPDRPVGVTNEPSGATFTKSELDAIGPKYGESKNYITTGEETKAAETRTSGYLGYSTKDLLKSQIDQLHNTPKTLAKIYDETVNDPALLLKQRKTEQLVAKEQPSLNKADAELTRLQEQSQAKAEQIATKQQEISEINQSAGLTSLSSEVNTADVAKLEDDILRLQNEKQAIDSKVTQARGKRDAILDKIDRVRERRKITNAEFMGAKQRVFDRKINQEGKGESLKDLGITKETSAGLSLEQISKPTTAPTIGKKAKQEILDRTVIQDKNIKASDVIGLGGAAELYTVKGSLGLGGKTGAERKKKKTVDFELISYDTPQIFDAPQKPGTGSRSRPQSRQESESKLISDTTPAFELITESTKKVSIASEPANPTLQPLENLIDIPKIGERTVDKPRTRPDRRSTPITIPKEIPALDMTIGEDLLTIPAHTPITGPKSPTRPPKNPLAPPKIIPAELQFPAGGGGYGRGAGLENPFVGIKEHGVENVLFQGYSLNEQGGFKYPVKIAKQKPLVTGPSFEEVLFGKQPPKGKKKKRRSAK